MPLPPLRLQQQFAALAERVERLRAVQREALRQPSTSSPPSSTAPSAVNFNLGRDCSGGLHPRASIGDRRYDGRHRSEIDATIRRDNPAAV